MFMDCIYNLFYDVKDSYFLFFCLLKIYLVYRLVFFIFMFNKDLFSLQFYLLHLSPRSYLLSLFISIFG